MEYIEKIIDLDYFENLTEEELNNIINYIKKKKASNN